MKPTREQIEEQIKNAIKEYLMSGEFLGLRISHSVSGVLLDRFFEKYVKFRLDKLYGKKKRVSNPKGRF